MIDTHAHLDDERLDKHKIISSMKNDGLEAIICASFDLDSSKKSVYTAANYDNVYAAVGIHPNHAHEAADSDFEELIKLAADKKVVAIGEMGLDYFHKFCDKDTQKNVLNKQLDILSQTNLPAVFHLRDAYLDMQEIVLQNKHKIKNGAVMHCFSGSIETAKFYTNLGYYISFGGAITFKNSRADEVIKSVPLDKILVETDCPYLSPEPFRGKVNEPKNVRYVLQKIASILDMDFERLQEISIKNAKKAFRI